MTDELRAASRRQRLFGSADPDIRLEGVKRAQLSGDIPESAPRSFLMYVHATGIHPANTPEELPDQSFWMWAVSRSRRNRRARVGNPTARSNIEVSTCLELMRRLVQSGRTRIARQYLHEGIDDLLRRGQFATVDALLFTADPLQDDPRILITLLTATKPARGHLRLRAEFFQRTADAIKRRNFDEPGLLAGLE